METSKCVCCSMLLSLLAETDQVGAVADDKAALWQWFRIESWWNGKLSKISRYCHTYPAQVNYTHPFISSHAKSCLDEWELVTWVSGPISLLQSEYAWRRLHREARKAHIASSSSRGDEFLWGHHTAGRWHTVFSWTAKHALSKRRGTSINIVPLAEGFILKCFVYWPIWLGLYIYIYIYIYIYVCVCVCVYMYVTLRFSLEWLNIVFCLLQPNSLTDSKYCKMQKIVKACFHKEALTQENNIE